MPWASREQDPRSALSPSSSRRPWHTQALLAANHNGRRCLSTECHAVADTVGHGCRAGALGLRPLLGTPARFLVGSISGATGLQGRVVVGALDMWRWRGQGGRHGRAQVSGCSSPYTGRSPLDLCQESNQNCGSLFTLGLLSAGKRTQSMLDAIRHIDPTAPVYHWKINRCDAVLREVMGENLHKEVIVASPKEDEGDFGCIVICGNEVLHGVANFMVANQPSLTSLC